MADDDRNDQLLTLMAADQANLDADFTFVDDGLELLTRLNRYGTEQTLPHLILLDLHMPKLAGHHTLTQLQAHPILWRIPVIVFSSSTRRQDIEQSIDNGARWFETKPSDFNELVTFLKTLPDKAANDHYTIETTTNQHGNPCLHEYLDLTEIDLRDNPL